MNIKILKLNIIDCIKILYFLGINESQIFAKVDYDCRSQGAEFLAYPPVVAGGDRATIIHYINNNQIVQDCEMILMDAGNTNHFLLIQILNLNH